MTEMLTRWAEVGAGGSIGFRFRERLSPTAASLSWVRAGHLAAFAALGWRYVFLGVPGPAAGTTRGPRAEHPAATVILRPHRAQRAPPVADRRGTC